MNFRANMSSLRALSDDYYHGRISFDEYRATRSRLLGLIDEDLNGVQMADRIENKDEEQVAKKSFVDKALSFLKTEQL